MPDKTIELTQENNRVKDFDPYKVKSFGHYQVRQMIDKGGFAYVYQVWDTDLKDVMALKVPILPDMFFFHDILRCSRPSSKIGLPCASTQILRIWSWSTKWANQQLKLIANL